MFTRTYPALLTMALLAFSPAWASKWQSALNKKQFDALTKGRKSKKRSFRYVDTKNFDLYKNGVSVRFKIKRKKAELTVKVRGNQNTGSQNDQALAQLSPFKKLEEYEYSCEFSKKDEALKLLANPALLLSRDTSPCKLEEDAEGPHPLAELPKVLEALKLPLGVTSWQEALTVAASNETTRVKVPLPFGEELEAEVEKTVYANNYVGYEVEVDVFKDEVNDPELKAAFSKWLARVDATYSPSMASKTGITLLVQSQSKLIETLLKGGQIFKSQN